MEREEAHRIAARESAELDERMQVISFKEDQVRDKFIALEAAEKLPQQLKDDRAKYDWMWDQQAPSSTAKK